MAASAAADWPSVGWISATSPNRTTRSRQWSSGFKRISAPSAARPLARTNENQKAVFGLAERVIAADSHEQWRIGVAPRTVPAGD